METEQVISADATFARAIYTKFHGPTNYRPARISAREPISKRQIVREYEYADHTRYGHDRVAAELVAVLDAESNGSRARDWSRALCGESADGRGYVYLVPLAEATSTDGGAL